MENKPPQGRSLQLWEYVALAIGGATLGTCGVFGMIVYFAINGNMYALAILAAIGVAVAIAFGGAISWATMWVNQRQDERAANAQLKLATTMMQQQQLASGQAWAEQMKALADGFRMKQQQEKALQEQAKTQRLIVDKPAQAGDDYLQIDDMEVQL